MFSFFFDLPKTREAEPGENQLNNLQTTYCCEKRRAREALD
ncbi:hypothetical protein [Roseivivax jejudonensis]|nr:hypothetical protein [Roseivivax jejudonensis]